MEKERIPSVRKIHSLGPDESTILSHFIIDASHKLKRTVTKQETLDALVNLLVNFSIKMIVIEKIKIIKSHHD